MTEKPPYDFKAIVKAAFPAYNGRKIRVEKHTNNSLMTTSYWDGGSRDYFAIVNLQTMRAQQIPGINPMNPPDNWRDTTEIPSNHVIVEHSIFCGKDVGCRIHFRANEF